MLKIKIIRDNITVLEKEIPKEIITHPDYWECDCEEIFVHRKRDSEQRHNERCACCGSVAFDCADARIEDVIRAEIAKCL